MQGPVVTSTWIRVAGSYNGSAPLGSNIALFAGGHMILNRSTEPGDYAGPVQDKGDTSPFTIGKGLDGVYLADVTIYNKALTAAELADITAQPTPAPAPAPGPPPPPPPPTPPPAGQWPVPYLSDTANYYSINPVSGLCVMR
jgi:hypothetical protein